MPISPEVARARAVLGNAVLRGDNDAAEAARQDLAAAVLLRKINAALAHPGLDREHRRALAARLTDEATS